MSNTNELINKVDQYGAHNYLPLPVVLTRGEGSKVWDVEGKEYLDFLSCYSALNFGHQHPRLTKALVTQMGKLSLCSRAFHNDQLAEFSQELADFTGLDSVLPMNSGAEAVETALKLARKWGSQVKGVPINEAKIVVMKNNFHGRTITIISFSSEEGYREGFGPFTPGFIEAEFDDVSALEAVLDDKCVGVLMEPIQAEAGILIPKEGYLTEVKSLCQKKNILFILDEIQTGLGRTGKDFCFQHEDATPDILILGKSLGGGLLPISAAVSRKEVMDVMGPGEHGSTFGGNPLACAVAREAMRVLKGEQLSLRSAEMGAKVMDRLHSQPLPKVKEVRGKGSLIGIEMDPSAGGARRYCEELASRGVLCKETHEHVIRIAPPLNIPENELLEGVERIIQVIQRG